MTSDLKQDLEAWTALVEKETRGRTPADLAWRTPEGIDVKPLYTAADLEGMEHLDSLPGFAPFVRGPRATMYAGRPLDAAPVRGLLHRRGVERVLPPEPGSGPDGAVHRVRPRDPPRLRLRSSAGHRRRRQGGRCHRFGRGHEDPVRRDSARPDVGVHDHERRRAAGDGDVHRGGRGAEGGAWRARRHRPERHPQGVHGPQHLHLSPRAVDAHRRRHHRVHLPGDAALQPNFDLRLSHAGGRSDGGSGTRLHPRRRHRVRARGTTGRAGTWTHLRRGCPFSSASA